MAEDDGNTDQVIRNADPVALQRRAERIIKALAPKVAEVLGLPTAAATVTIGDPEQMKDPDTGASYPAWTEGSTIVLNPEVFWSRKVLPKKQLDQDLTALLAHELAHATLGTRYGGKGSKGYIVQEGLADYVKDKLGLHSERVAGSVDNTGGVRAGYESAAKFFRWLNAQDPGSVKELARAHKDGDQAAFQRITGDSLPELIEGYSQEMPGGKRPGNLADHQDFAGAGVGSDFAQGVMNKTFQASDTRMFAQPVFLQGEGTDQKPKGEAKRLNDAIPAPVDQPVPVPGAEGDIAPPVDADGDGVEDTSAPQGVQLQSPSDTQLSDAGLSDELKFLLGDSTRPDEPVRQGLRLTSTYSQRVDPEVYDMIPHLIMAAKDPEAPAQLKMLVQLLSHHLGKPGS